MTCFDQLSRSSQPETTGIHFFTSDYKFKSLLAKPDSFVEKFIPFSALLTPDLTLGTDMPTWMRMQRTFLSRAVGAYFCSRFFDVIPTLRWIDVSDLDFVYEGLAAGGVYAVGSLGNFRNQWLRSIFEEGVLELIRNLNPSGLLIYGKVRPEFLTKISNLTLVVTYSTPTEQKLGATPIYSDLFS